MASAVHAIAAEAGALTRTRLAGFVRTLRDNGFASGLAETRDALRLLATPSAAAAPATCRSALRALFCGRRSDWERFDELFSAYWQNRGTKTAIRSVETAKKAPPMGRVQTGSEVSGSQAGAPDHIDRTADDGADTEQNRSVRRDQASPADALTKRDFRHITDPDEIEKAHALAARLARSMRARMTRRTRARRNGERLDLRRTIHRSIGSGGTPVRLVFRQRKPKPLRLVILLDVSGSMEVYAPVFVRFMHGVLGAFREAETFLFHTRLMHVSPALRERDPARAVERLTLLATGIGGGTEIGGSLATFNRLHAKRVIHARTAVMIISDGYDTGDPERLGAEMRALRRRCRRIAWLNPMMGWRDYSPEARGMRAALPFVDLFAPAHNLESLLALEPYLAGL